MFIISIEKEFDAAHYLRGYQGRCERLHGHRYRVMAHITAKKLDKTGLAFDFSIFKKILYEVLEKYDHRCLNDIAPFKKINPSAENIAHIIYKDLAKHLPKDVVLDSVDVWESPESCATFRPG